MPLVTVFSSSLKYLKDTIIRRLDKTHRYPSKKYIWILTVPAIWNYGAKKFMRQAAEKVRIYRISAMYTYVHTVYQSRLTVISHAAKQSRNNVHSFKRQ